MSEGPPWEDPRRVLGRHGLRPKRSFSQNFLVSRSAVERIAEALDLEPGARVVELGPGVGTLTAALLRTGAEVIAVERDREMLAVLDSELGGNLRLTLREGDAAAVRFADLGSPPLTVAGNLPYAITGAILRNLTDQAEDVGRAVLMVQREVKDRLVAEPGVKAYGALTVFVSAAFRVEGVLKVPAGAFHPPPKVDSAVVRLTRLAQPRAEIGRAFTSVVKAAFGQRRKTLRSALKSTALGAQRIADALADAGIDGARRGETLSVEEFAELASHLAAHLGE